jgi:hypothetical protein
VVTAGDDPAGADAVRDLGPKATILIAGVDGRLRDTR